MPEKFFDKLNIFKQCRRYNLSLWRCPQFLFLLMGGIIIISALTLYLIGTYYISNPEIVIFLVLSVTAILFVIAYTIINGFENLAEVSKLKSDFIDIVSHQLRSPLTNIKWTFEALSSGNFSKNKSREKEYFENIKENIKRMVELTDDLLIVSRIEQGTFPIVKKEISIKKIVEELISRFKVFAEVSNIKINFHCQKGANKVFADPSLLKLVIENLINNALHYTSAKGKVEIDIKKDGENQIVFSIKDNGLGIPKEEQKYIFQKFFRAKNALRKETHGSGLGLYVCHLLIRKSGGKIWFKSEENKGTVFYFSLPIK